MMRTQKRMSAPMYWLSVVAVGLMVGFGVQFAKAWVDPVAAPPGGNVAGPVTTGPQTQTKGGGLNIMGDFAVAPGAAGGGNLLLAGSNSWVLHTPDDGRSTLYLAYYMNGAWQWNDSFWFDVNPATFGSKLSVNQVVDSKDGNFWLDPNSTSRLNDLQLRNLYTTTEILPVTAGWALVAYGTGWSSTGTAAQRGSHVASLNVNDIYLRSSGRWLSEGWTSIGGIYDICHTGPWDGWNGCPQDPDGCWAPNPFTGACSCPAGYGAVVTGLVQHYEVWSDGRIEMCVR